jgi:hypothetical protein
VKFWWPDAYGVKGAAEAGTFGRRCSVGVYPAFRRVKYHLDGPGDLYRVLGGDDPDTYKLAPAEPSVAYESTDPIEVLYRPPPNDEVPPDGTTATVSIEVLNTYTGNWVKSYGYAIGVSHRDGPADAYFLPSPWNEGWGKYYHYRDAYPDDLFSRAEIAAGETYGDFYFCVGPRPAEDLDMQRRLDGPAGYAGPLGELATVWPDDYGRVAHELDGWTLRYTAPSSVEEPVEITAVLSIYDPWAKERREHGLVFRVVPVVPK